MILAIDMGNSNIVVGGIDNKQIYFLERITTHTTRTELEYSMYIKYAFDIHTVFKLRSGSMSGNSFKEIYLLIVDSTYYNI